MRIPIERTKKQLILVWFIGAGLLFTFLLFQTFAGKYKYTVPVPCKEGETKIENKTEEVWSWLLPTFVPTLSLMIGVFVADATTDQETKETETVDQFFFRLSFFLSIAYLSVVLLTIIYGSISENLLELVKISNKYLAPFQGLITASRGVFFVSKK